MDHLIRILGRRAALENSAEAWQNYAVQLERLLNTRSLPPLESLAEQVELFENGVAQQLRTWGEVYPFQDIRCPVIGRNYALFWPGRDTWYSQNPQKVITVSLEESAAKILKTRGFAIVSDAIMHGDEEDFDRLIYGHLALELGQVQFAFHSPIENILEVEDLKQEPIIATEDEILVKWYALVRLR